MRSNLLQQFIDQISKITGSQQRVAGPFLRRFEHITGVAGNNPFLRAGMLVLLLILLGLGGLCAASGGGGGGPQPQPPGPQVFGPAVLCPGEKWSRTLGPYRSNVVAGPASSNPVVATAAVMGGAGDVDVSDTITITAHSPGQVTISLTAEMWELNAMNNHSGGRLGVGHLRRGDIKILVQVPDCTKKEKEKPKPEPTVGIPPTEEPVRPDVPTVDRYDHSRDEAPVAPGPVGPEGTMPDPMPAEPAPDSEDSFEPDSEPFDDATAEPAPGSDHGQDDSDCGNRCDGKDPCSGDASGCDGDSARTCDPCDGDTDCAWGNHEPCPGYEPTATPEPEISADDIDCELVDMTLCGNQPRTGDKR